MPALAAFHEPEPVRLQCAVDRTRALLYALGAAEQTLNRLSPSLLRAASQNRAPLNRDDRLVARETDVALREAEKLVDQLRRAKAALAAGGN